MFSHLVSGTVGAVLGARGRPRARFISRHIYGPRTGRTYLAEEFPDSDMLIVHAEDSSQATFLRVKDRGWTFIRARGNEATVKTIRLDLEHES